MMDSTKDVAEFVSLLSVTDLKACLQALAAEYAALKSENAALKGREEAVAERKAGLEALAAENAVLTSHAFSAIAVENAALKAWDEASAEPLIAVLRELEVERQLRTAEARIFEQRVVELQVAEGENDRLRGLLVTVVSIAQEGAKVLLRGAPAGRLHTISEMPAEMLAASAAPAVSLLEITRAVLAQHR